MPIGDTQQVTDVKYFLTRKVATVLTLFAIWSGAACAEVTRPTDMTPLQQELTRITATTRAVVGVSLYHIESGRSLSVNGGELFPMASTVKVPVAVHILTLVDQGKLKLDQTVTLSSQDVYPSTHGPIAVFFRPGSVLTVRDLLTLMLVDSDNNATDVLIRLGGGMARVKARMRELGLTQLNPDRLILVLLANLAEQSHVTESNPMAPEAFRTLMAERQQARDDTYRARARTIENTDLRDTSSPDDMATLLRKIWNAEALSPESSRVLLGIMSRCITGERRLRGMLPAGTSVLDKTGSLGFTTNDVGIIELPGSAGHLVAVVFTKDSYEDPRERRETVIAHVARAAYDYFLFTTPRQ